VNASQTRAMVSTAMIVGIPVNNSPIIYAVTKSREKLKMKVCVFGCGVFLLSCAHSRPKTGPYQNIESPNAAIATMRAGITKLMYAIK